MDNKAAAEGLALARAGDAFQDALVAELKEKLAESHAKLMRSEEEVVRLSEQRARERDEYDAERTQTNLVLRQDTVSAQERRAELDQVRSRLDTALELLREAVGGMAGEYHTGGPGCPVCIWADKVRAELSVAGRTMRPVAGKLPSMKQEKPCGAGPEEEKGASNVAFGLSVDPADAAFEVNRKELIDAVLDANPPEEAP